MNVIEWNIGFGAKPENIMEELKKYMNDSFIFMILEVVPAAYEKFVKLFGDAATIEYSLEYRKPGKYDSKARKLGVMIATSNDIEVLEAGVFERALYPDRTMYERIKVGDKELRIAAIHSITGCSHLVSKSDSFRSMAEALDELNPDIVTMDANEPEVDHYEIRGMKFFEQNGEGAGIFFRALDNLGLKDSKTINYDIDSFVYGEPLDVSFMVNGIKPMRYDFVFVSDKVRVSDVVYDYDGAVAATADHAVVRVEAALR